MNDETTVYHCIAEFDDTETCGHITKDIVFTNDVFVIASTRGKARSYASGVFDCDFTYPMSIRKITHSVPFHELKPNICGNVLNHYFVTDDKELLPDSELAQYLELRLPTNSKTNP